MLVTLAQAAAGLALLYFGGGWLIRGASGLASRLGVSPLAVGLTVVAFGTSAPELVVSIDAALSGAIDISVGNVVGSNIANIALILGLAALLRPAIVVAKIVRVDAPIMVVVSFALLIVLADGTASRMEGALLLTGLVGYVAFTFWEARRETAQVRSEFAAAAPARPSSAWAAGLLVVLGLALLVGGGHLLVASAIRLSVAFGLSEAAVGLTIVAVGTSLPEAATSILAARRGQGDIAVGNVVGSNIFNVLGILGVSALVRPLTLGGISWLDLGLMAALAVVLATLLFACRRIGRVPAACLLVVFVGYSGWLLAA